MYHRHHHRDRSRLKRENSLAFESYKFPSLSFRFHFLLYLNFSSLDTALGWENSDFCAFVSLPSHYLHLLKDGKIIVLIKKLEIHAKQNLLAIIYNIIVLNL